MIAPPEFILDDSDDVKSSSAIVLIVDDCTRNIQIVGSILTEAGYEVMPATSGRQALARIVNQLPDLILLDLMMPEIDGMEVCRRLKNDPATQEIPVIFLTASSETGHLVEAFESGAVDYVTKPFNAMELLARVKTHLELKQNREALQRYANQLREMNNEKNELMSIAAHDLRNPLNNLMSCIEMIRPESSPADERQESLFEIMTNSVDHMLQLVNNLLDVNAIESGKWQLNLTRCDLREILVDVVNSYDNKAAAKQQSLILDCPLTALPADLDFTGATEVIGNLISNAIKYSPPGKAIQIRADSNEDRIRIEVQDQGPGLTPEDKTRLFGKFARLSARPTANEPSTGLGLSIVKKMVELMNGSVGCESEPGHGATFFVEWPTPESDPLPEPSSVELYTTS